MKITNFVTSPTKRYLLTMRERDDFQCAGSPDELVTALRDDWNERALRLGMSTKVYHPTNESFIRKTIDILAAQTHTAPIGWPLIHNITATILINYMAALQLLDVTPLPTMDNIPEPV